MKMRTYLASLLAILLLLSSCGSEKPTITETETPVTTVSEPVYEVHDANPAWASEELNDRVSPARSIAFDYEGHNGFLKMALHYSSPSVKNRTIWDSLVTLNEVWRTGANEATMIEFSNDVHIQDQHIKAGSYSLFTVPKEEGWTVILNSVADQWGHYEYDSESDVARFDVANEETDFNENLLFNFQELKDGSHVLSFSWENRGFNLRIEPANDLK